jgi:1,4-alpha-glucan branching enzyme
VPRAGFWREILNTDAAVYGGTGSGNLGGVAAQEIAWDNVGHSLELTLPPMSTVIFKWAREG